MTFKALTYSELLDLFRSATITWCMSEDSDDLLFMAEIKQELIERWTWCEITKRKNPS